MPCLRGIVTLVALSAAACGQAPESRQYEVHGQILRIDTEREEVLVDHDDIEGFMPAMSSISLSSSVMSTLAWQSSW